MATQKGLKALFSKAQGGDKDAFDELADSYRVRLLGIIRHRMSERLQGQVEPEDVYHPTFRISVSRFLPPPKAEARQSIGFGALCA